MDHKRIPRIARERAVLRQFRVLYGAAHRHFRAVERRCGVSGAQAWMLGEISRAPGIGVSALATQLSIHQTTCSQLTAKLVRAGLVRRVSRADDRRRVGLTLSRRGALLLRRMPRPVEGVLPLALSRLTPRELGKLHGVLSRFVERMQGREMDGAAHLTEL